MLNGQIDVYHVLTHAGQCVGMHVGQHEGTLLVKSKWYMLPKGNMHSLKSLCKLKSK